MFNFDIDNTFITSDTHFWHKNILKYSGETRPFESVEEMNEAIIERWNKVVHPNSDVLHLGDFAFANRDKTVEVLKRLNGNIHYIYGNHDRVMREAEVQRYLASVDHYREIKVGKTMICLSHYPIFEWNKAQYGSLHCHGHLHSTRIVGRSMDVGIDSRGGKCDPWSIREVIETLKSQPIVSHYHTPRETENHEW